MSSAQDQVTDLARRLEAVTTMQVTGLHRLSGGASRETWSFTATDASGAAQQLILRRDPPALVNGPSGAGRTGGMPLEARLFGAAAGTGVPVPRLLASGDADPERLASGFLVMEHVDGETIARKILRDEPYAHTRSVLVSQLGEAAANIHSIAPESVPGLLPVDPLVKYRELLDDMGHTSPTFELAFRWLHAHRLAPIEPCVVHGDFRLGNVIVNEKGLAAVLDWELAHLGDPAEDLSWLCVRAWRFGGKGEVAGMGSIEELLRAYHLNNGRPEVDAARVHWWIVAGTLMWGVMCVMQGNAYTSGAIRSVELAAIGRRIAEQEHDLLDLMGAPSGSAIEIPSPPPSATAKEAGDTIGFPTAAMLVHAVRDYLEQDVMPATSGRVSFHGRVAQNVLAIVERELHLGPDLLREASKTANQFDTNNEQELATRIKSGALDGQSKELLCALRNVVQLRVAIANPKHATAN